MRYQTAGQVTVRTIDRLNPITGGPAAPLETRAMFAAFGPSLMPRASLHQGLAAGLSVLAGELVSRAVDAGIRRFIPGTSQLPCASGREQ
jgi:hypothetical protein